MQTTTKALTNGTTGRAKKLTKKQITECIRLYAARHGYYARTVRAVSVLFYAAIKEFGGVV